MDTSIALSTQTIVLPEAGSPKMLGRESRSLESKSFPPLFASPPEREESPEGSGYCPEQWFGPLHHLLEWKAAVAQSSTAN